MIIVNVISKETGKPCVGERVWLTSEFEGRAEENLTDENGVVRFNEFGDGHEGIIFINGLEFKGNIEKNNTILFWQKQNV